LNQILTEQEPAQHPLLAVPFYPVAGPGCKSESAINSRSLTQMLLLMDQAMAGEIPFRLESRSKRTGDLSKAKDALMSVFS